MCTSHFFHLSNYKGSVCTACRIVSCVSDSSLLHWSTNTESLVCFDHISDGSRGHLISSFTSCTVSKHPFSQGFFYNSNYAVWHSPLRQHACLFSSSKHAFTGFWLCTTTASGSVKVLPSHALPPRKINPLPRIRRRGCALTLRASTNQHGVANGDGKGSRGAQHDAASRLKTSQPLSDG